MSQALATAAGAAVAARRPSLRGLGPRILVPGIMLLAFSLRMYRLEDANLWIDEGWTIWLSRQSLSFILQPAIDPPIPRLHYLFVYYWLPLVGDSEFALRFSSVVFAVATVALIYVLGRRLEGEAAGMAAAGLLAVSGLHCWASQVIRMYSLAVLLSLASLYFFARIWGIGEETAHHRPVSAGKGGSRLSTLAEWATYWTVTLAALHTHYLSASILLGENVFVLILATKRIASHGKRIVVWMAAQAFLAALSLPGLWHGMKATPYRDFELTFLDPVLYLRIYISTLVTGVSTDIDGLNLIQALALIVMVAGVLAAMIIQRVSTQRTASKATTGMALISIVLLSALAIVYYLSLRSPPCPTCIQVSIRYFLIAAPVFYLLLAGSIVSVGRLWRPLGIVVLFLTLTAGLYPTINSLSSRRLGTDNGWYLGRHIAAFAQPGDAVAYSPEEWSFAFRYYMGDGLPLYSISTPEGRITFASADAALTPLAQRGCDLWLVEDPICWEMDPHWEVRRWLEARFRKVIDTDYGGTRLALFTSNPERDATALGPLAYPPQWPTEAQWGDAVRLVGYDLQPKDLLSGETFPLVLYWEALQPLTGPLTWEGLMVNDAGKIVAAGRLEAPPSSRPLQPGERGRSRLDFTIAGHLAPGRYSLCVGVLGLGTKEQIDLKTIGVKETTPPAPFQAVNDGLFGGRVRLLGYSLAEEADDLVVLLLWEAKEEVAEDLSVFVHLVDGEGRLVAQHDGRPVAGGYAISRWRHGEQIVDAHQVGLPQWHGPLSIRAGLYEPKTGQRLRTMAGDDGVTLTNVTVVP